MRNIHGSKHQVSMMNQLRLDHLANVLAMFAAGHKPTQTYATLALEKISAIAGTKVGIDALHSTLGRHAARCVRTNVLIDVLKENYDLLIGNIASGDVDNI